MHSSIAHTEFAAQLKRVGMAQAAFARLCDITTTAVSHWCHGRRRVPAWAWAIAIALETRDADELGRAPAMRWHETLGVPEDCAERDARAAWTKLAKKNHVDAGGDDETMKRINNAYDAAKRHIARTTGNHARPGAEPTR